MRTSVIKLMGFRYVLLLALAIQWGCTANPLVEAANQKIQQGDRLSADEQLSQALKADPNSAAIQSQLIQNRNRILAALWPQFDTALANRQLPVAREILLEVEKIDPRNSRLLSAKQLLVDASAKPSQAVGSTSDAVLLQDKGRRLPSLEFRDAPLRSVLDALGKLGAISFIFDKDVRTDTKITISLRDVTTSEALRAVLLTQQLESKALNETSVVIFPATAPKIRDYVELQTRSFYLNNIEAKQAQALIKALVKTRDVFIDEKLNLMVIKDTPAAISYAEKLIESVDLAEPEVVLDVVVLEISNSKAQEIGLRYPSQFQLGLPTAGSAVQALTRDNWKDQIVSTASPSLLATLKANFGETNLLSNPSIRVKNREKARIHIGEKLPVFTSSFTQGSSSATGTNTNAFSTQISFLEVGLKLDVEPLIYLQNEVSIKLGLEVSNVIERVLGPADSVGYRIGTRNTVTSLRLRDGETQIIAGLIRDDDRKSAIGIPGLAQLPLLGRLFGSHANDVDKTEIVLMITPRIVRSIDPPAAGLRRINAGTDSSVGAPPVRLSAKASIAVAAAGVAGAGGARSAQPSSRPDAVPATGGDPIIAVANADPNVPTGDSPSLNTISISMAAPDSVAANSEFDFVIAASPATGDTVVELVLAGDAVTMPDGGRGTILINLTGDQTVVRLKALAVNRSSTISVAAVRNARGSLSLATATPVVTIRTAP